MARAFERFLVHDLLVHAKTATYDAAGSPEWHTVAPVTVRGYMRQIDSKEAGATGLSIFNTFVFWTKEDWKFSTVTHVEWLDEVDAAGDPRVFDQHGTARVSKLGRPTDNSMIYFIERGVAA